MQKCFLYLLVLFFSLCKVSWAQNPVDDGDKIQNQNLELLGESNGEEDADYTNLIDHWNFLRTHPLNLNFANSEALQNLGLLNDLQIVSLLNHIQQNGKLLSLLELQGIKGFDLETISRIRPYVYVKETFDETQLNFKDIIKNSKQEIILRYQQILEPQKGFRARSTEDLQNSPSQYYVGDPSRTYLRYRIQSGSLFSAGLIAEKDAGETFKKIDSLNKKPGFDFYTAHIFIRNVKFVKALAIGDYQAAFGQGLILWRGFAFGKSSMIANVKRSAPGLRAYNSVDENRFFRGAATTLKFGKIETSLMYSRKKIDANVSRYDTLNNGALDAEEISSIIQSGYHSTINELKDRRNILETVYGGNVSYKGKAFSAGITGQYLNYSASVLESPKNYNQFDFKGKSNYNFGIDFNYVYRNFNLFGEAGISKSGGIAFCAGSIMAIDPKINLVVFARHFDKKYQNLLASPVAENTFPQNEQGIYIGTEIKLPSQLSLNIYLDQFRFPWLKYKNSNLSEGYDFFSQVSWNPNKKTEMYLRFRSRTKTEDHNMEELYNYAVPVKQNNYRYNVSFQLLPYLKLRSRIEYLTLYKQGEIPEEGALFFQDIVFKKMGFPLEVTARYGLFQTDTYNSRVYAYENDVLYSFSIPAQYEKGSRAYLLLNYTLGKHIELWLRIAQTLYYNKSVISESSLTEIQGPSKTEVKFQMRLKF